MKAIILNVDIKSWGKMSKAIHCRDYFEQGNSYVNYPSICENCCHNFQLNDSLLPYCNPCLETSRKGLYNEEYEKIKPVIFFWEKMIFITVGIAITPLFFYFFNMQLNNIFIQFAISLGIFLIMGIIGYYPLVKLRDFKRKHEQRIYAKMVKEFPFNQNELDELEHENEEITKTS